MGTRIRIWLISEQGNEISGGSDIPEWLDSNAVSYAAYEKDDSTGEETITLRLSREGDFVMSIINQDSSTLWPCGPLKVVAAPSE